MTLHFPELFLLFAGPFLIGAGVLRFLGIGFSSDRLAFPAWSWLAGALATAAACGIWVFVGRPFPARLLGPLVLGAALLLGFFAQVRPVRVRSPALPAGPELTVFRVAVVVIGLVMVVCLLRANDMPVVRDDEAHIWAARAKLLFDTRATGDNFVLLQNVYVAHPDYPLLNPLLQMWVYSVAGRIVHVDNRLPIQMFTFALLLVLASATRRYLRPAVAAALLVVFFAQDIVNVKIARADGDMMVAFSLCACADAWLRFRETGQLAWWRLFCLALAMLLWSKAEGGMLALVLLGGIAGSELLVRRAPLAALPRPRRELAWLLVPSATIATTVVYNHVLELHNDLFVASGGTTFLDRLWANLPTRWWVVLRHFAGDLARAEYSRWLIPMFAALALTHPLRALRGAPLPCLVVAGAMTGYALIFVATPVTPISDLRWHLVTAAFRCLFHLTGVAALGLSMCVAVVFPWLRAPLPAPAPAPM
jgi:hypothetical protein